MSRAIFETRFFIHFFSSPDPETHELLLGLMRKYDRRLVSAITLFEIYKISLEREGKETAETRISRIKREFSLIPVDDAIAIRGAQLKHATKVQKGEDIPMADSLMAATGVVYKAVCITDSPHFNKIPQVKPRWIQ
jgi:predicted nucleic acid-binding protein